MYQGVLVLGYPALYDWDVWRMSAYLTHFEGNSVLKCLEYIVTACFLVQFDLLHASICVSLRSGSLGFLTTVNVHIGASADEAPVTRQRHERRSSREDMDMRRQNEPPARYPPYDQPPTRRPPAGPTGDAPASRYGG